MSRVLLATLFLLLALPGCSRNDPLEQTLAKLQPGAPFPAADLLPAPLRDAAWTVGRVHKVSSDLPMSEGGSWCSAYTTVLRSETRPAHNVMAVFCGGKRRTFAPDAAFFTSPTASGDPKGQGRFEATFVDALEPGREIVWHSERSLDPQGFLTIRERAWRERDGKLEQILDTTPVDPALAKTKLAQGRRQFLEAQNTYAPGFTGSHPKQFVYRGKFSGRPFVRSLDYTEATGYRGGPTLPGPSPTPPVGLDGGSSD
ncbi:MAG: hypothetical protein M3Y59_03780 [Myxococcota bacterium]|nr:hypothetical protein [Myxococcota bacterium]